MSSPIKPSSTYNQDVRTFAKSTDNTVNDSKAPNTDVQPKESKVTEVKDSIAVTHKKQLNAAIIESSLKFSNSIGDQPLSLVLKTALQGINEALKADGANTTIEEAYDSGIDTSPEATAERIVTFSTQFLASYREQHPEMDESESLSAFVKIISSGIDQGFGEAKDILSSLNVLEDEMASTIDQTYELVQSGIQAFVDSFSEQESE